MLRLAASARYASCFSRVHGPKSLHRSPRLFPLQPLHRANFASQSDLPPTSTFFTRLQRLGLAASQTFQSQSASAPLYDENGKQTSASPDAAQGTSTQDEPKLELSRLLQLAKDERRLIGFALSAQLISASSIMLFPFALGKVVDTVSSSAPELDALVALMGGVFAISAIASATRVSAMSLAGSRISRALRVSLFHAIMKQETAFFDKRQSGELVNRLSSDVPLVSRTLTDNLAKIIRAGVTSTASLGFILYLSPTLSLVTLGSIPPILGFAVVFGRAARKLSRQLVDALAEATQVAAERTSAIRTVRTFGAEDIETKRYANRVDETYHLAKKVAFADGLYAGCVQLSAQMSLCGVLWFGGRMVIDPLNPMTMGALTSFSMYAVNLGVAVSGMGNAYGQLTRALGAGHRIFEVIDRVPDGSSSTICEQPPTVANSEMGVTLKPKVSLRRLQPGYDATVSFEDVHFKYPTQPDTAILNGVNLTVRPGEIMAIAGASGSGKSTMSSLLSRLYEPTSGTISLGNEPIANLDTAWLREQIAVVAQEPVLFNGTVTENIQYAMPGEVSMQRIQRAARAAASHDMILSLPNKYETMVGERGASLSGGQRARTALCRALVRDPRVLVLDEHSAALDAESERAVAQAVYTSASELNMAVITIAHRTSSLRRADRVAVLADGVVIEIGSYNDLMKQEDSYLRQMLNPTRTPI